MRRITPPCKIHTAYVRRVRQGGVSSQGGVVGGRWALCATAMAMAMAMATQQRLRRTPCEALTHALRVWCVSYREQT